MTDRTKMISDQVMTLNAYSQSELEHIDGNTYSDTL